MSDKDDLIMFAINGLRSTRTELTRLADYVADMISVLSDVLADSEKEDNP